MKTLWLQVGVTARHLPILVARNKSHLLDFEPCFEEAARAFVAKVMKVQIVDLQPDWHA